MEKKDIEKTKDDACSIYAVADRNLENIVSRVRELSAKDPMEYELIRDREAADLGIRVTALDKEVEKRRQRNSSSRLRRSLGAFGCVI